MAVMKQMMIVLKSLVVLLEVIIIWSMASVLWEYATEDVIWENDESLRITNCETYLREKEYGELWEYLELYDLHGERYQVYWNAIEDRLDEIQENN